VGKFWKMIAWPFGGDIKADPEWLSRKELEEETPIHPFSLLPSTT
jgi:hypothetical protein